MDALNMLDILSYAKETKMTKNLDENTSWYYSLAEDFGRTTLVAMTPCPEM